YERVGIGDSSQSITTEASNERYIFINGIPRSKLKRRLRAVYYCGTALKYCCSRGQYQYSALGRTRINTRQSGCLIDYARQGARANNASADVVYHHWNAHRLTFEIGDRRPGQD